MTRILVKHSASFGEYQGLMGTTATDTRTNTPRTGAAVDYETTSNRRRVKLAGVLGFKLICNRIIKFEIEGLQWYLRSGGIPQLSCSMTIFNVRPYDTPIFEACRRWDFGKVTHLIQTGQASLHDVDDKLGGLLEVKYPAFGHRTSPNTSSNVL